MASHPPRDSMEETGTQRAFSEGGGGRKGRHKLGTTQSLVSAQHPYHLVKDCKTLFPRTPLLLEKLWVGRPLRCLCLQLLWAGPESLGPDPDVRTWRQEQREGRRDSHSSFRAACPKGESQGLPLLPDADKQGFLLRIQITDLI